MTTTLLLPLFGALAPSPVYAAEGPVRIDDGDDPSLDSDGDGLNDALDSPPTQVMVQAGANVNLFLGEVLFDGSEFLLYWSEDGLSQLSDDDVPFAPADAAERFALADLRATCDPSVDCATYSGGYVVGNSWINGTIPPNDRVEETTGGPHYVKVFDGSASAVAVLDRAIDVQPGLSISPSSGPAGTPTTVRGSAFDGTRVVNVSITSPSSMAGLQFQATTNEFGSFTASHVVPDAMGTSPGTTSIIYRANYADEVITPMVTTVFTQNHREWLQISREFGPFLSPQGNTVDVSSLTGEDFPVFSEVTVAGNYFNPQGQVTLFWDYGLPSQEQLETTAVNGTGFFNTTITIPETTRGDHTLTAKDVSFNYNATLMVVQGIMLEPTEGPVGTSVKVTGVGWHGEEVISVYWDSTTGQFLFNATTDADGSFMGTFEVPPTDGGTHDVVAQDAAHPSITASAEFFVTPTVACTTEEGDPAVNVPAGDKVICTASGAVAFSFYQVNVDNHLMADFGVRADSGGVFTVELKASVPGSHHVSIYRRQTTSELQIEAQGNYSVAGTTLDDLSTQLQGVSSTVNALFTEFSITTNGFHKHFHQMFGAPPDPDTPILPTTIYALESQSLQAEFDSVSSSLQRLTNVFFGQTVSQLEIRLAAAVSDTVIREAEGITQAVETHDASVSDTLSSLQDRIDTQFETLSQGIEDNFESLNESLGSAVDAINTSIDNAQEATDDSIESSTDAIQTTVENSVDELAQSISASSEDLSTFLLAIAALLVITLLLAAVAAVRVVRLKSPE